MKTLISTLLAAVVWLALPAAPGLAAQLEARHGLTLDAAKAIAAAAEKHARANNWNVVIAILSDGGELLYLQRMDGVQPGSIDVALKKARTAYRFRRPTKVFSDAVASGRTAIVTLPDVIAIEGGLPVQHDGKVIGAVGVSGVTAEQDGMIAAAGLKALSP